MAEVSLRFSSSTSPQRELLFVLELSLSPKHLCSHPSGAAASPRLIAMEMAQGDSPARAISGKRLPRERGCDCADGNSTGEELKQTGADGNRIKAPHFSGNKSSVWLRRNGESRA